MVETWSLRHPAFFLAIILIKWNYLPSSWKWDFLLNHLLAVCRNGNLFPLWITSGVKSKKNLLQNWPTKILSFLVRCKTVCKALLCYVDFRKETKIPFHLFFSGDGRMDSPGHCAQFCTYTLMEKVQIKSLDKRETEGKSGNLEKAGFIRGMQEVQDSGLKVAEVVTDAHIQIGALMSKY